MSRFLLTMAGIALVATNVGWLAERHRHAETRSTWAAERAASAEAARLAEAEYRARERTAAETLTAIQRKAEDEKTALRRRAAAVVDSLRDRPARPAGGGDVPPGATDPVACTGAGLYRADGEFLVWEATRADQLRTDLAVCQAAYDASVRLTNP